MGGPGRAAAGEADFVAWRADGVLTTSCRSVVRGSQGKAPGPTPFQVANAAAAAGHPLKTTSTGTIIRRNGSSGRVATLSARVPAAAAAAGGDAAGGGGAQPAPPPPPPAPPAGSGVMARSDSTSSSSSDHAQATASSTAAPLPTPPASFRANGAAKASRSGSTASLSTSSSTSTIQRAGKTLYCSPECAAADQHNTDLASHLSEALHLYSPASLEPPWTLPDGLPSPFLVSGSDSEAGDYFHRRRSDDGDPHKQPLAFIAHGTGVRRYSSRSATTATTATGSSSDSLASLWDHPPPAAAATAAGSGGGGSAMAHSASSHGLRRMTPLNPMTATPPLLSPIASVPISAQSLVPPPPASSPLPPSSMGGALHASPALSAYDGPNSFSSSSSLANYRSASHSRVHAAPFHPGGHHHPSASVAPSRQPSAQGGPSSFSSSATFEPGSAPAAASLYASYAASFQRTPSVEARLASFGSPRRQSTTSVSSLRTSRLYGGGSTDDAAAAGRGRTPGGSFSSSSGRLRSRSRASDAALSEEGDDSGGSGFGRSLGHHQITPTQSSLLTHARPANPRRQSDVSTDSNSALSCASSDSADRSRATSGGGGRKGSSPTSHDHEYLTMPPPQSTGRVRPPPAPSRKLHQAAGPVDRTASGGSADAGWSWGNKEKMYEIPRVASTAGELGRDGVPRPPNGSLGKLFYWGS